MDSYDAFIAHVNELQERGLSGLRDRIDALAGKVDALKADLKSAAPGEVIPAADLKEAVDDLRQKAGTGGDEVAQLKSRIAELEQGGGGGQLSLEVLSSLDKARSQSELLREMLTLLAKTTDRSVVLVIREGVISAWSGIGFANAEQLRQWRAEVDASPILKRFAAEGKPFRIAPAQDPVLSGWLQAEETPTTAFLLPMCLRGNLVGGIYIDHGKGSSWDPSSAQVLIAVICWLIDTLGFRQTVPTPMLAELEDVAGDAGDDVPPAPTGAETQAQEQFDPSATVRVDTAQMAAMASAAGVQAPVAPPPPSAEAAAPAAAQADTGQLSPEEEARHEEARRFARLLVSEIKLYNESEVERGRANKDIYQRLKEDIDRSREMFEKRIPTEVRQVRDYFQDEIVRILADGDTDALGM